MAAGSDAGGPSVPSSPLKPVASLSLALTALTP